MLTNPPVKKVKEEKKLLKVLIITKNEKSECFCLVLFLLKIEFFAQ